MRKEHTLEARFLEAAVFGRKGKEEEEKRTYSRY